MRKTSRFGFSQAIGVQRDTLSDTCPWAAPVCDVVLTRSRNLVREVVGARRKALHRRRSRLEADRLDPGVLCP